MVRSKSVKVTRPVVSVILPVYNAEKYLLSAVESILHQTYTDFELIIVDDASTDTSWDILQEIAKKDPRIHIFRNKINLKLSHTLNRAIEQSSGDYIARMDADDWSYPDRLEKQVTYLENHPEVGIVGGTMEIISAIGEKTGERRYPLTDSEIRKSIFWFSPYSHPLIMMRNSILIKTGPYKADYNPAEDYELYFRIGSISKFANLPDTLLKYRIIPKSMTTGSTKKMEEKTIAIRELHAQDAHFHMSISQKLYNELHKLSLRLIPSSFKMRAFHVIRNTLK